MIVLFDFNASLNDVAPLSPILFPVDLMGMEKEWIADGYHLCCFFLSFLLRLSSVSVVFDFNASLNDVAFVSSIPLSVDSIQHKTVKNAFFSMHSCVCDTRHNKSSALNGTRFIKRQILTFESLKICPVIRIFKGL